MQGAIQVDGKRLYDLARKGGRVEVPVRTVEISQIQVLDWRDGDFPELDVAIFCGTGTYISAIARDLGKILNIGGTLSALIRTESSSFQIPTSLTFTDLAIQIENGTFQPISPAGETHLNFIDKTPFLCINERIGIYRLIDFFKVIVMV